MANKLVAIVLQEVADAPDVKTKLAIIQRYRSFALNTILQFGYDPRLTTPYIPEGDIPAMSLAEDRYQTLESAVKSLTAFTNKGSPKEKLAVKQARHQKGWINLTSIMRHEDRKWLIAAKDKTLPVLLKLSHKDLATIAGDIVPADPGKFVPVKIEAPIVSEPTIPNVVSEDAKRKGIFRLESLIDADGNPVVFVDEDEDVKVPVKRGRGRPKGSKNKK